VLCEALGLTSRREHLEEHGLADVVALLGRVEVLPHARRLGPNQLAERVRGITLQYYAALCVALRDECGEEIDTRQRRKWRLGSAGFEQRRDVRVGVRPLGLCRHCTHDALHTM
jgi:hypothetical protein